MKVLILNFIKAFIYPRPVVGLFYLPRFIKHFFHYRKFDPVHKPEVMDMYPCLLDWTISTPFDPHYFYQGAWLARKVKHNEPDLHVDVGSSVMMISVLSAMVKTVFVDYRPLIADLSGMNSVGANITQLPFQSDSLSSLSCQHVIEHIGLGRYGDPIDPDGSINAAKELERVLKPGGKLYLSLPVGRERICFNAHRVHAPNSVVEFFSHMKLIDFSYVDDNGAFLEEQSLDAAQDNEYACGMYVFEKTDASSE